MFYLSLLELQRDRDRFTELYETYRYRLYHTAMCILHDQALAEDAVHDVFIYIIVQFDKVPVYDDSRIGQYLIRSVKNRSINIKDRRKFEESGDYEKERQALLQNMEPDNLMILKEKYEYVIIALKSMDDRYRLPLEYLYLEEKTPQEIAEIMEIPQPTIYKRIERGHRYLLNAAKGMGSYG